MPARCRQDAGATEADLSPTAIYETACSRNGETILMPTQAQKGMAFRALHQRDGAFIIPNPWDPGTARLLESLGFEALATTSAGFAFSIGKPDGAVDREAMLAHASALVGATGLPVS